MEQPSCGPTFRLLSAGFLGIRRTPTVEDLQTALELNQPDMPWLFSDFSFLTPPSSDECLNAISSKVPRNFLNYAKIAIPLLDKCTSGWEWSWFAYLLATVQHQTHFGTPDATGHDYMYEKWTPTDEQKDYEPVFDGRGRVTTSHAAHAVQDHLEILLPIPDKIRQPLLLAKSKQEGFLMKDAADLVGNSFAEFEFAKGTK